MTKCGMMAWKGHTFFYPNCMGGAVYGIDGCTCSPISQPDEIKHLQNKIKKLEKKIENLEAKINGKVIQ